MPAVPPPAAALLWSATMCISLHWHDAHNPALAEVFKSSPGQPNLMGKLGIAPLPGSTYVWDRSKRQLETCNADLCRNADMVTRQNLSDPSQNVTLHVNRMMYGGGGGFGYAMTTVGSPSVREVRAWACCDVSSVVVLARQLARPCLSGSAK